MVALVLLALLILLLFGLGFAVKFLWYAAIVLLVLWIIGLVARGADRTG
jgi:hypothetical protein